MAPLRNRHDHLHQREPKLGDGQGPWPYTELLRMDAKFSAAIERAFKSGDESREAASRVFKALG